MGANKITYYGNTLIDLTNDSVTSETLAEGVTAHDASGNVIVGTAFGAKLAVEDTNEGVKITATDKGGTTSAIVKDGKEGKTPVKYVDYFTDGDIADIVTRVHDSIGTPLFGTVDENNNVILSGKLADGEYSIKYEMEDKSTVNIGKLVLDTRTRHKVIINELKNCSINNSATEVPDGDPYNAIITAHDGYELSSVTVTMGGNPETVTDGVINIASVTGNIVINATATEVQTGPTNFAKPTTSDGWLPDNRLSTSSGNASSQTGMHVTNYIDVKAGDVLSIEGLNLEGIVNSKHSVIHTYTSSKGFQGIAVTSMPASNGADAAMGDLSKNGNVFTYTVLVVQGVNRANSTTALLRIGAPLMTGYTKEDVVINIKRDGKWL